MPFKSDIRDLITPFDTNPFLLLLIPVLIPIPASITENHPKLIQEKSFPDEDSGLGEDAWFLFAAKGSKSFTTLRGNPDTNIISETVLYKLIIRSNKPAAKLFSDITIGYTRM